MNKLIKAVGLSLVVLSGSLVAQAAEAAQKMAYVNTQQIFQQLPQREAAFKKLQKEMKDKAAELKGLQTKIETKVQEGRRNAELMSDEDVSALQVEIAGLQKEYQLKAQSLERESKRREGQERQKLFKMIQDAIKVVAEKEKVDMVIDASALQYAKPELNLTDKVINQLK